MPFDDVASNICQALLSESEEGAGPARPRRPRPDSAPPGPGGGSGGGSGGGRAWQIIPATSSSKSWTHVYSIDCNLMTGRAYLSAPRPIMPATSSSKS